jgi:DNA-binding beta-propeller fold protein YncE
MTLEGHGVRAAHATSQVRDEDRHWCTTHSAPSRRRPPGVLEMPKDAVLSSPRQLVVDNERGRVLVADTDHHRVVILDFAGQVQHVIGTGAEGRIDAACEETLFRYPRGIAADADFIYVADTGNRIIRRVDRRAHRVTTIAGSGDAGRDDGPADPSWISRHVSSRR